MNDEQPATPQPAEPVAWRALGGEWNEPQDMEYRYGAWVDGLDPLRFQPLYEAATPQQPAAASAGASELVKAKKLLRDFFQDDVGYYRSRELMAEVASCIDAAIHPPPAKARPTDDELWDQTLRERDTYCEWADKLAEAISRFIGFDIGEHSSANNPWARAIDMIPAGTLGAALQSPPVATACDSCENNPTNYPAPQVVAWLMEPNAKSHPKLRPDVTLHRPPNRGDWAITPLVRAPTGPCKDCDVVGGCPEYCRCGDFAPVATTQRSEPALTPLTNPHNWFPALHAIVEVWADQNSYVPGTLDKMISNASEEIVAWRTLYGQATAHQSESRCPLCRYQHGHSIGCDNNPVDIALKAAHPAAGEATERGSAA